MTTEVPQQTNNLRDESSFDNQSHHMTDLTQQLLAAKLREFVDTKRSEILRTLEGQLTAFSDELIDRSLEREDDQLDTSGGDVKDSQRRYSKGHQSRGGDNGDDLPRKVYRHRQSVLTDLLHINHIRTVYHIFVAILVIFSLNTMLSDWVEKGGIVHTYHVELVIWACGDVKEVVMIWLLMKLSTIIIVYPAFVQWTVTRPHPCHRVTRYDFIWLAVFVVYQIAFLVFPLRLIYDGEFPPVGSTIIVMEQLRMLMKVHAFVRENTPRVIWYKEKQDQGNDAKGEGDETQPCPNFSHYLFFLFAPTLVYRNNYPRSPFIRWPYVVSNFAQVFFCVVYMYYILSRFCFTQFNNFNQEHVSKRQLVVSAFNCMLPGGLVLLICFFAFLHSWLNAFAEMLRFGDRLFYKDWWTSTSFGNFYRTWNVVVHDWLYTYIYSEVYRALGGHRRNRSSATAVVFLISAVFHEYVLTVAFRFFYPVLFCMFGGAGFGFMFIKGHSRFWNVALWVALFSGTGLLMCLYSMEWYARINCPVMYNNFVDYLIPRTWFCTIKG